jgi:BON domain
MQPSIRFATKNTDMVHFNWLAPIFLICALSFVADDGVDHPHRLNMTSSAFIMYDLELERGIRALIDRDEGLKAKIDVIAKAARNEVTLSGVVASPEARTRAVELAKSVHSELIINDRIIVRPTV